VDGQKDARVEQRPEEQIVPHQPHEVLQPHELHGRDDVPAMKHQHEREQQRIAEKHGHVQQVGSHEHVAAPLATQADLQTP